MRSRYPQIFLDFQIGTKAAGRVIFELFNDVTPKTAENYRGLCTGEYGNVGMGKKTKRLHYINTTIHRIVDNMCIQGGDIINNDGTGGSSIYGPTFVDENFSRRHACAGLLSMCNRGRNTNNSQFFITLKPCPHLDGKNVVFGQVIEGIEVIRMIGKVQVDMQDRPKIPVLIINCGEITEQKNFIIFDPFKKSALDEMHRDRLRTLYGDEYVQKRDDEELERQRLLNPEYAQKQEEDRLFAEKTEQQIKDFKNLISKDAMQVEVKENKSLTEEHLEKVHELQRRMQQAKVMNDKAVLEEERLNTDAQYDKLQRKKKFLQKKELEQNELEFKQIDQDQAYLNRLILKKEDEGKKKKDYFGWDVFNDEAVYNAYTKRCTQLVKDQGLYENQKEKVQNGEEIDHTPNAEALDRLSTDITKQISKRKNFSRRRRFNEDQPVTYINERNRIFNQKLQRSFGTYAADIKANLERGTAS
ncbi:hypothetical protein pb186bvf_006729 [Paramecium bursaria]